MHSLQSKDKTADANTAESPDGVVDPGSDSTSPNSADVTIAPASFIDDSVPGTASETKPTSIQNNAPSPDPQSPVASTGGSFQFGDKPIVPVKPSSTGTNTNPDTDPASALSSTGRALLAPIRTTNTEFPANAGVLPDRGNNAIPPLVNNNPLANNESPFPMKPPTMPGNLQPTNILGTPSTPTNSSGGSPPTAPPTPFSTDTRPPAASGSIRNFGNPPTSSESLSTLATQPLSAPPVSPRQQEFGGQPVNLKNESITPTPFGQKPVPLSGNAPITTGNPNPMTLNNASQTPAMLAAAPVRNTSLTSESLSKAQPVPGEPKFEGVQIPALAVQKIAPREVQVNREATFELIVKNTGRSSAENVQVHDFVPDGARFVSAVPGPTQNVDGRISWDLGTMAPGQQVSIQTKILPERPGDMGSVAHVTFGAQASAKTVCTQPQLSMRHESPESILIGQDFVLNIFVENKGNGAADDVVLQEDVPEGLEFAGGQKELEYAIGTLQPGETRNIQLRLRAARVGQVRNVLVAHGAGKLQANDVVNLRIVAPQMNLQADGPTRKFLNRPATHTFSVANQGTAPATNMQLVARLPRGLKFASANNQGQYDPGNHLVVWRLSKLDPEKTGSVELTTIPVATGSLEIQVQAIADLNQQQQITRSLVVEQLSELFFDIDDSADAIEVGTGTTFRVRVVNQGQIPATNVNVQVDFAEGIRPESVEGNIRNQIREQAVVLEPISNLAPGQEVSFVIRANAVAAGEHRTVVSVKSDDRDIAISKEESTHVYSDR